MDIKSILEQKLSLKNKEIVDMDLKLDNINTKENDGNSINTNCNTNEQLSFDIGTNDDNAKLHSKSDDKIETQEQENTKDLDREKTDLQVTDDESIIIPDDNEKCLSAKKRKKSEKKKRKHNKKHKKNDTSKTELIDETINNQSKNVIIGNNSDPEINKIFVDKNSNIELQNNDAGNSHIMTKETRVTNQYHSRTNKSQNSNSNVNDQLIRMNATLPSLQEQVVDLKKSIVAMEEFVVKKLTTNDENWKQLKNVQSKSKDDSAMDLININRPPDVGYVWLDDGMIHLGEGVWLPKAIYDNAVYNASTNAMFVKNIAVAMFGDQYLREHSVKGKSCNKTKSTPRPAIDPTKAIAIYEIFKYYLKNNKNMDGQKLINVASLYEEHIRSKISDLLRPPRQPKKKDLRFRHKQHLKMLFLQREHLWHKLPHLLPLKKFKLTIRHLEALQASQMTNHLKTKKPQGIKIELKKTSN
ncbi:uncharacterized protein LOC103572822 isoform X2 [Microplitis demolitor]|uniref:uncharacterized protein LOC103572822 isoform X2 n=1 Tax=Microplitis demolitor TaxID=69319 RepID=UPI00235B6C5C|nr:uncharacterized protein LOC103572822 isoform X2 [Microplitis demolitor]